MLLRWYLLDITKLTNLKSEIKEQRTIEICRERTRERGGEGEKVKGP